jgi:hypothetical protein
MGTELARAFSAPPIRRSRSLPPRSTRLSQDFETRELPRSNNYRKVARVQCTGEHSSVFADHTPTQRPIATRRTSLPESNIPSTASRTRPGDPDNRPGSRTDTQPAERPRVSRSVVGRTIRRLRDDHLVSPNPAADGLSALLWTTPLGRDATSARSRRPSLTTSRRMPLPAGAPRAHGHL